jgi:hypothetical protein
MEVEESSKTDDVSHPQQDATVSASSTIMAQQQQQQRIPNVDERVGGGNGGSVVDSSSGRNDSNNAASASMNWEPVRSRLLGEDLKDALSAARRLREQIEVVHTTEYPLMLSALLPAFSTILTRTTPNGDSTSTEFKLRNIVLEILSRMPSNEVLRPHAPHLVAVALDILKRDYEDNALLACGIIFNLYKQYRSLPQDYVQPFLDFVMSAYRSLPGAVSLGVFGVVY